MGLAHRRAFALARRGTGRQAAGGYARVQQDNAAASTQSRGAPFVDVAGTVRARCWCDRADVQVALSEIRAGRTGSCGRKDCAP